MLKPLFHAKFDEILNESSQSGLHLLVLNQLFLQLASNPHENAIQLLKEHCINNPEFQFVKESDYGGECLDHEAEFWFNLSLNASDAAIELLLQHKEKIVLYALSMNSHPEAIRILQTTSLDKLNYQMLHFNSHDFAVNILLANQHRIDVRQLACNSNDNAVTYCLNFINNNMVFDYANNNLLNVHVSFSLCTNPHPRVVALLKEVPLDILPLDKLAQNSHVDVFPLFLANKTPADFIGFSLLTRNKNPDAFAYLVENYPNHIDWTEVFSNPNIFDTEFIFK